MEIIISAAVSLLVQYLKQYVNGEYAKLVILLLVSIGAATIYTYLVSAGYWQTVAQVLVTSSAFYALVIKRFES